MIKVAKIEHWGSDESIVASARQSTDGAFRGWGTPSEPGDEKLLRYLWSHKHSTPFEFAGMTVQIEAPIFVARQIYTHRTFSRTEMSARYTEMKQGFYEPTVWHEQSAKNRQASHGDLDETSQLYASKAYNKAVSACKEAYEELLALGVSREQARIVMPLCSMTQWRQSGNLRNWLSFLDLRLAKDVQEETRWVAEHLAESIRESFPRTWDVYLSMK